MDQLKGQALPLQRRGHDVFVSNADGGIVLGQGHPVQVFPFLDDVVGDIPIGEAVVVPLEPQDELGLQHAVELLTVGHGIAEFLVKDHTGKILVLELGAVELLVFSIGGHQASHEGEQEHEGQDYQARHGDTVAEEPFGNHGARRQDLHPAVVV